jgi:transposase
MEAVANPVSLPSTKRSYRSVEERRRIVEETLVPGVSVATVARAHGVNANQVFGWRKLYQTGLLEPKHVSSSQTQQSPLRLLPVMISTEAEQAPPQLDMKAATVSCPGSIELVFANARVQISGQVDTAALRVILESLRG